MAQKPYTQTIVNAPLIEVVLRRQDGPEPSRSQCPVSSILPLEEVGELGCLSPAAWIDESGSLESHLSRVAYDEWGLIYVLVQPPATMQVVTLARAQISLCCHFAIPRCMSHSMR